MDTKLQSPSSDFLEHIRAEKNRGKELLSGELAELIQSECEGRLLFERNPLAMWIFDIETLAFLRVNEAAISIYGYSREEFLSMTLYDIRPEDDAAMLAEDIAKRNTIHHRDGPWRHRKKDGSIIDVEITSIPIEYGNRPAKFVMAMDITERRRADEELRKHVERLARSNSDLKQFAHAASHDLQEPIRDVTIFAQLLSQSWDKAEKAELEKYTQVVLDGAKRIQKLVEGLRLYWELAETEPPSLQRVDTNTILREVLRKLKPAIISAGASIHLDTLPILYANERELSMIFEEVLGNALKFRSDRPLEVRISARRQESDWQISVQDNGIGMKPEYAKRIFGIFKRLSRSYSGIGMGLAITHKIVERHDGRIWVHSEEGKGSTFFFTWPVSGQSPSGM
ncbi:MAG TPA: ATP-binding protein [Bryobacteraceae bacterium]|nr:ATP-binding protein [Bryobacteraceae bacterium]